MTVELATFPATPYLNFHDIRAVNLSIEEVLLQTWSRPVVFNEFHRRSNVFDIPAEQLFRGRMLPRDGDVNRESLT
jgi:hypothetical protein